jgi:hypothetical protein
MKTIMSSKAALRLQQDMIAHAFQIFPWRQTRAEKH